MKYTLHNPFIIISLSAGLATFTTVLPLVSALHKRHFTTLVNNRKFEHFFRKTTIALVYYFTERTTHQEFFSMLSAENKKGNICEKFYLQSFLPEEFCAKINIQRNTGDNSLWETFFGFSNIVSDNRAKFQLYLIFFKQLHYNLI